MFVSVLLLLEPLWLSEGWLFGGFILLGPPAIGFSEALCVSILIYIVVDTELHGFVRYH